MDSQEKLKETKLPTKLPSKEAVYSRLTDEHICNDYYAHTQSVWKESDMKTLKDYHNLFNQVDVFLLADVFDNVRYVFCKHYN